MPTTDTAAGMTRLLDEPATGLDGERVMFLETLAKHRMLLRHTVTGLSEADARRRPTASALTLGGILTHVEGVERVWTGFVRTGVVEGARKWTESAAGGEREDFALGPGDTVAGLLDRYAATAERTDELVRTVDLGLSHPLPPAPWFPDGKRWSARQVLAHVIGEIAQHSGHADILRETIDGQRSMG